MKVEKNCLMENDKMKLCFGGRKQRKERLNKRKMMEALWRCDVERFFNGKR